MRSQCFCLMGRFPILSVEWRQPWKGHLKGLYCDGLSSTLPPMPVFRLGYFHAVCTIVGPRSPEFSWIRFVNTFPQYFVFYFTVAFTSFFIITAKQLCFLFRCQKVDINTSWVLHITDLFYISETETATISNDFETCFEHVINMWSVEMCVELIILALKGFKLQRFKNLYLWIVFLCCPFVSDC